MFPYEDSKTVSVCRYPEKRNHPGFVNISSTLVIDSSMEKSSRVLQHGNIRIFFFSVKFGVEFCPYPECPYPKKRNHPNFVNISPTLVIDTSMERSSWIATTTMKPKNLILHSKKFEIEFWLVFFKFLLVPKSWNHSSRYQHACTYMTTSIVDPSRVDI